MTDIVVLKKPLPVTVRENINITTTIPPQKRKKSTNITNIAKDIEESVLQCIIKPARLVYVV
jgi:hypothetical protein